MAIEISKNDSKQVTYENQPQAKRALFPNLGDSLPYDELKEIIEEWLEDNPEYTTTVEDGSLLPVKLDSDNEATANYVLAYDGTKFVWVDIQANFADEFDSSHVGGYTAGDYVMHEGQMYVFTSDHTGNWDASDVQAVSVELIASNLQEQIDDLKQDIIDISKQSEIDFFLAGKKTHSGLELTPKMSAKSEEIYMLYPSEWDYYSPSLGKFVAVFSGVLPERYKGSSREHNYILYHTHSDTDYELTDATAANRQRVTSSEVNARYNYIMTLGLSTREDRLLKHNLFRFMTELYDENGELERRLYSSQIDVYNVDGTYGSAVCSETVYPSESDCIVSAYYSDYRSRVTPDHLSDGISRLVSGGIVYGCDSYDHHFDQLKRVIPWDTQLTHDNNNSIVAVFVYGDGTRVISEPVTFIPPSTTMTQAVSCGDVFCLDDLWYKATTDLDVDDTIVIGTNVEAIDEPVIPTEELPTIPTTDGTYHLEVSIASGVPTMTWVSNT